MRPLNQKGVSARVNTSPGRLSSSQRGQKSRASHPQLSPADLLRYERDGWCITRQLLPVTTIDTLKEVVAAHVSNHTLDALRQRYALWFSMVPVASYPRTPPPVPRIRVLCPGEDPAAVATVKDAETMIRTKGTDVVGFLQFFNLHRTCTPILAMASSQELAGVAAQLLDAKKVRLYQDCVFLKEPGFAQTNWHSDLRMAPFDSNSFVTAWIPLRDITGSSDDSGLQFAAGSHRDFALPFWHDLQGRDLSDRKYRVDSAGAMAVGDVSWHHGWTLHCAGPQPPRTPPRAALAISFFADGARLLPRKRDPSVHRHMLHSEDAESYSCWVKDLKDGAPARHRLLPLVWPAAQGAGQHSGQAGTVGA